MIKYKGISTLEVLEDAVNYNKWIASEVKPHLTFPTLEIGSGTGNLSHYLIDNNKISLSDNDKGLVEHLKERFSRNKNIEVLFLDVTKKKKISSRYNSIFAINVLEHIKDDRDALKNIHSLLNSHGRLVLLVPAKQFAYTKLDASLGHFRRYEKKELVAKLQMSGFEIDKIYYFNIVGLISWKMRALVEKDSTSLKSYQVKIFDKFVPLLQRIELAFRPPIGISLIVIAHKK